MKQRPVPQPAVIDALAFILLWNPMPYEADARLKQIKHRIDEGIQAGRLERSFANSRYRQQFRILLDSGSKPLVQIGAVDTMRQKGGIRITLNPSQLQAGDGAKFKQVMRKIIGREFDELMQQPLLNRIDIAVDILYAHLDRMLVHCHHAHLRTMFAKRTDRHGHIEGFNFGGVTSDYMMAVYDKRTELRHKAVLSLMRHDKSRAGVVGEPLTANMIKQVAVQRGQPEKLRVEVRGKKLRGLPLWKLGDLPNRFRNFRFADLATDGEVLPPLIEKSFHAMCRQDGVDAALAAFTHSEHARAVNAYWRNRQSSWWQPDPMWHQAWDSLRATDLFPPEAFVDPAASISVRRSRDTMQRHRTRSMRPTDIF